MKGIYSPVDPHYHHPLALSHYYISCREELLSLRKVLTVGFKDSQRARMESKLCSLRVPLVRVTTSLEHHQNSSSDPLKAVSPKPGRNRPLPTLQWMGPKETPQQGGSTNDECLVRERPLPSGHLNGYSNFKRVGVGGMYWLSIPHLSQSALIFSKAYNES